MTPVSLRPLVLVAGLFLAAGTPAHAQEEARATAGTPRAAGAPAPAREDFIAAPSAGHWSAEEMIGLSVYDKQGADLGPVVDVLLGAEGEAAYVVFETGGFLGSGEKLIAAPLRTFHIVATAPGEQERSAASAVVGTELPPQNAQGSSDAGEAARETTLKPLYLEFAASEEDLTVAPPFSRNPKRIPAVAP
jgi:hypothetical protein